MQWSNVETNEISENHKWKCFQWNLCRRVKWSMLPLSWPNFEALQKRRNEETTWPMPVHPDQSREFGPNIRLLFTRLPRLGKHNREKTAPAAQWNAHLTQMLFFSQVFEGYVYLRPLIRTTSRSLHIGQSYNLWTRHCVTEFNQSNNTDQAHLNSPKNEPLESVNKQSPQRWELIRKEDCPPEQVQITKKRKNTITAISLLQREREREKTRLATEFLSTKTFLKTWRQRTCCWRQETKKKRWNKVKPVI